MFVSNLDGGVAVDRVRPPTGSPIPLLALRFPVLELPQVVVHPQKEVHVHDVYRQLEGSLLTQLIQFRRKLATLRRNLAALQRRVDHSFRCEARIPRRSHITKHFWNDRLRTPRSDRTLSYVSLRPHTLTRRRRRILGLRWRERRSVFPHWQHHHVRVTRVGSRVELRLLRLHLLLREAVLLVRQRVQVHALRVRAANAAEKEVAVLRGPEARPTLQRKSHSEPNLRASQHTTVTRHDTGQSLLGRGVGDVSVSEAEEEPRTHNNCGPSQSTASCCSV